MTDRAASFRTAAADAYDRHIGRYGPALAAELIAVAGVSAGARALDVGCGPGALTTKLAALLGPARVSAVDPSPPFAEACQARLPGVSVQVAAAESLPFADGTFDCALAQLVVNFMADAAAGVAEMRRVTRAGGTVAAAVWDYAGEMTILRQFWDAAVALDPSADHEGNIPFATPAELEALWSGAGLAGVAVSSAVVSADYGGFEDLWAPLESGVAPSGAYTVSLEPAPRAALKAAFRDRLGVGDEPFQLTARAWIVTGHV